MVRCDDCGTDGGSLTFKELQEGAERPFDEIVRRDGEPIGFPVHFCWNPYCNNFLKGIRV